jgi:hypothetical protein
VTVTVPAHVRLRNNQPSSAAPPAYSFFFVP